MGFSREKRERACCGGLFVAILTSCVLASTARAQPDPGPTPPPDPPTTPEPAPPPPEPAKPDPKPEPDPKFVDDDEPTAGGTTGMLERIQIHGFVSEGGFLSTANDYIGTSSRGSFELFEVGINFSTEVTDRLRVGVQLFARDVGVFHDPSPRLDWAFLDYRWKPWLGLRAGVIKMPFGLYNEYADVDTARLPILMPQSVYPVRNREALLAHRGFSAYGNQELGDAGTLEYQVWLGTLIIPDNALSVNGAKLDRVDTKYVTGAQAYWHPPVEGLRVGGTFLRTSIDFYLTLDASVLQQLVMAGLVPADFDGKLVISQRPDTFLIASAEYIHGDWLFAAEYARSFAHTVTTVSELIPTSDSDAELFYGMVNYRLSIELELGGYYSVNNVDANDRHGNDMMRFPKRFQAFQRDAAATLRYDVNSHWLWKVEAHFIDGAADLDRVVNPNPERYWGLFLFKTTVSF